MYRGTRKDCHDAPFPVASIHVHGEICWSVLQSVTAAQLTCLHYCMLTKLHMLSAEVVGEDKCFLSSAFGYGNSCRNW